MNKKPKIQKECKVCKKIMFLQPSIAVTKSLCSKECNIFDISQRKNFLGKKHTEQTKQKISFSKKGKPAWNKNLKGYRSGPNHHWFGKDCKAEKSPVYIKNRNLLKRFDDDQKDRRSSIYKIWRKSVIDRDMHRCRINNKDCNGRLEVHHILGYTKYPELRYQINNGITLCHAHHPRVRAEEKRLIPTFQELVTVSKVQF